MSEETKSQVAFFIYHQISKDKKERVAIAYMHKKGGGHSYRIGNEQFVAFPQKKKLEVAETGQD